MGEDSALPTLSELISYHAEVSKYDVSRGTLKNYKATESHLKAFLKKSYKTDDFLLCKLSFSFLTRFEHYLRTNKPTDHQRMVGNNTTMKHIQRFRKMIKLAVCLEWMDKYPFANFKTKFTRSDRGYLTEKELNKIEKKVFVIPRLQLVKDIFLFSCYTGLSYIDIMVLTKDNIATGIDGYKWVITERKKTGRESNIPLLPKAEELLIKYENDIKAMHNGTCFPKISNQKLNTYLKEIADVCSIQKNITFHLARHTFATTVTLANDVPISTVSKMLGHSKIATTQIYARVLEKKVSSDMITLRKKLHAAKNDISKTQASVNSK